VRPAERSISFHPISSSPRSLRLSSSSVRDPHWIPAPLRSRALRLARRYSADADEAEDIVQEALVRAWRRRETLIAEERLWPWLARIVANEAMRAHARRRWEAAPETAAERGSDDAMLTSLPQRLDLGRGLERIDPAARELLRLRYTLDLTQAEIAARLGLPEGTVKVRLHRARAQLRRNLTE
jgi:RNA polymerase sigma-70 factor (ECF subfamily)